MKKRSLFSLLMIGLLSFGASCSSVPKNPVTPSQTQIDETAGKILRYGSPEEVGLAPDSLAKIDEIVETAIQDSVFPGAVAAVVKDGMLVFNKGFGYQDYSRKTPVENDAVYDLASITKIAATTISTMRLLHEGKISLEDHVSKYIPQFKEGKKSQIRIRDLLLHQSGLPPFRVYVDSIQSRDEIVNAIKHEPLTYEPATKYVYSDLGMILLGEIIHQISGLPLDEFANREFYEPLGMTSTGFNPAKKKCELLQKIPPTEIDTVYDRGRVHGAVHDERAYYMDGVAGHAGLFSSAEDLAKLSVLLLNGGSYDGHEYFKPWIVELFTGIQSEHSGRGYGFDRKSREGFSSAGSLASANTFGHLGFTGTSIWMDADKNMTVILLTNRTFPYRSYGSGMSRIRAKVADAAFSAYEK